MEVMEAVDRTGLWAGPEDRGGVPLEERDIEGFLSYLRGKRRSAGTIEGYRKHLRALSAFLDGEPLRQSALAAWREAQLREGYTPRTVNTRISAANSFLEYVGRRDLQLSGSLPREEREPPALTRNEYISLLRAAKDKGSVRTYLLVKVFALVGLTVKELPEVTVEAVQAGVVASRRGRELARIPPCLQRELLAYARERGTGAGPVFVTQRGRPVCRTNVSDEIRALSARARVAGEKCNPRCLRKLYLTTQAQIQQAAARLMEQTYDRLLETEQLVAGWEDRTGGEGP